MKEDLVGLKTLQEEKIRCNKCGSTIAHLEVIETNESRIARGLKPFVSMYKVENCPNCRSSSFWTQFYEGTVIVGSTRDDIILEGKDTEILEDNSIKVILYANKK